jgi:formylglycine-generating enzyme required for sulfatase activity
MPCPPRWRHPDLAGLYYPVTLDRAGHVPPRPAGPLPWSAQPPDIAADLRRDPGARHLLTLLSACIQIGPPLLRRLRMALPAGVADVGSEAAAWQHPAFSGGDGPLVPADHSALAALRDAFAQTGTASQRALAQALILAQQQTLGLPDSVRLEEQALRAAQQGGPDAAAEAYFARAGQMLETLRRRGAEAEHARLRAWVDRRAARSHRGLWQHSPASIRLWLAAHPEALETGAALPPDLEGLIHQGLGAAGVPEQLQVWTLVQRGEHLVFEPQRGAADPEPLASGSPVIERLVTRRPLVLLRPARRGEPWRLLGLGRGQGRSALPVGSDGWRLRTEHEDLAVEPLPRPRWAQCLGRDGRGLFVRFQHGTGERRADWCPPLEWLRWPGSPLRPSLRSPRDDHGGWIDAEQLSALRRHGLALGRRGLSLSRDQYGLRAEITLAGIPTAFRWVWPGTFQMGSPESEAGRYDDERQHEVVLTRGLWLAETACTQALWEAVMGENPSRYRAADKPVENVSWEAAVELAERLNGRLSELIGPQPTETEAAAEPGAGSALRFRLPTEAEWEYACRAGTTTAYAFGETFDPKLANNNGSETVPVRSLPANPWGFFEMHGNVWEWCQDWFGDYPPGPVIDPVGPAEGSFRVLRGGSWFFVARYLRSASRYHVDPGDRSHTPGVRLALGPEPVPAGGAGGSLDRGGAGRPAQGASVSERTARAVGRRGGRGGAGA